MNGNWPSRAAIAFALAFALSGSAATPAPAGGQGAINVLFMIHFDPLPAPGGHVSKGAYEQHRDNLAWLAGFLDEIGRKQGREFVPKLTLEIAGDHAEYYAEDPAGLALLQRLHAAGHDLGIHFHGNYKAGPHEWPNGQSQNTPEMHRRVTTDHIREVDALVGKIIGSQDPAAIRRACHIIQGPFVDQALAEEQGFDTTTTGQSERLNTYFDHDPLTAFRLLNITPQAWQLADDARGHWIMLPSGVVLGSIGIHSVWVDYSVPAMRRKFLQIYLEWRAAQLSGAPNRERVWVFGWHEHTNNLFPQREGLVKTQMLRGEVGGFVTWLNQNFVNRRDAQGKLIARYATATEAAAGFKTWEAAHPAQSSFNYPDRTQNWNAYPHQLPGLARELMYTHHESEIDDFHDRGVHLHKLIKTEGPSWSLQGEKIVNSKPTWPVYLMWCDTGTRKIDLSRRLPGEITCVDALNAAETRVESSAVGVSTTPAVCVGAR